MNKILSNNTLKCFFVLFIMSLPVVGLAGIVNDLFRQPLTENLKKSVAAGLNRHLNEEWEKQLVVLSLGGTPEDAVAGLDDFFSRHTILAGHLGMAISAVGEIHLFNGQGCQDNESAKWNETYFKYINNSFWEDPVKDIKRKYDWLDEETYINCRLIRCMNLGGIFSSDQVHLNALKVAFGLAASSVPCFLHPRFQPYVWLMDKFNSFSTLR